MKKLLPLCLVAMLSACLPEGNQFNGYVEGEYLYISPTSGGLLADLSVRRGQTVQAGDPLFAMDLTGLKAAHATALAEGAQAKAKWNDLMKGRRPEEIEIILQQQEQARVALGTAEKEYARAQSLIATKAISQQTYDTAKAAYDTAQARVAELAAQLKTAGLGAREDEIMAARAAVEVTAQKAVQTEKQVLDAAPRASLTAMVEDTFFNAGEYVAAGKPVVSLLPPEKVKVRFFVPQKRLAELPLGKKVMIGCDGCGKQIEAKVTYIGTQAEFTPPVIYSIGSREKLVFLIEATPSSYDPVLKPGLPVDIAPSVP